MRRPSSAVLVAPYDFVSSWPLPDDDQLHRAGRIGVLDQKEDEVMPVQEWLGLQHSAYLRCVFLRLSSLLDITREECDVRDGSARLSPSAQRERLADLRARRATERACLRGFLGEYEGAFGRAAAQAFTRVCIAAWRDRYRRLRSELRPTARQSSLF